MTPQSIQTLRTNLNLSRKQFADALGFTGKNRYFTVWRWETGERQPSEQTVRLMRMLTNGGKT